MTTTSAVAPPRATRRRSALHRREHRAAALFVAIPVIGFLAFVAYPLVFAAATSFTNWNGITAPAPNGIANYVRMLGDEYFWKSLGNTVFLMLGIPLGLILSLLLALAMNRKMRGTTFFRTIYYIPVISSIAAIAILWQWAYNGDFGLVNQALAYVGIDGPNWLQDAATAKPAIILMTVWKGLGYSMLLYLAALQSVPRQLYEAASLDGASAFQQFRAITVPMLRPVTFFLVVTNIIGGAQIFVEINIMTPTGGPEFSTATIVWYIWRQAFEYLNMGYATAMSIVLGILVFVVTAIQFALNRRSTFSIE
ncbi:MULTISPECIES: carbohydrate ABC transporter permease [Microbacterium]|uniref:Sugar ABC transporter permease n=1 Tax=Microbacterium barkeri TaxID=33917 RepID=A0A9W6H6J8_9MICO|nr:MULTISPECIES: sugar ABC transporter permease [Microbacterium]MDI6944875.1 sugar ABC transporter permease [Microbacterium barkeri]MDR6877067.1 multiple sugar transport system permease protein [Microbacterium barkeri]WRH16581.1 ABC transporter permease subunit [Microbacterium sp. JZ37]GLJ62899.1 sugar ABC transporter permease [Microbacterium barkeri]